MCLVSRNIRPNRGCCTNVMRKKFVALIVCFGCAGLLITTVNSCLGEITPGIIIA